MLPTTRRDFLALAAAAATLSARSASAAAAMPTRKIPTTGESLPIVGLGSTRPVTAIAERGPGPVEAVPLPAWAAEFECESWAQFSLQYILANPAVTAVLTETTSAEHMAENALTALKPLPRRAARARMRTLIAAV